MNSHMANVFQGGMTSSIKYADGSNEMKVGC